MAQQSMFWTTSGVGDGPSGGYPQDRIYDMWRKLLTTDQAAIEGVLWDIGDYLSCSGTSLPLTIQEGAAIGYGLFYENTSDLTVTGTFTPSIGLTGGRINLKIDWTAQKAEILANQNTDGVSALPSLTQSAGAVWELPLYTYQVTTGGVVTLTDVRQYAHFATKVNTSMLDDLAVTTAKIATGAVTSGKLGSNAVIAGKIASNAVEAGDIASGGVSATSQLADSIVTSAKIANRTRTFLVPAIGTEGDFNPSLFGVNLPDAAINSVYGFFQVPKDFVSGMTVKAVLYSSSSGNVYYDHYAYYGAVGEAYDTHTQTLDNQTGAITASQRAEIGSLSLGSAAIGDYVTCQFRREGNNASDTVNAAVYCMGFLVSYTADS